MRAQPPKFGLTASQVPDVPASTRWVDMLRWCVCDVDCDDYDLGFLASLLSYALRHGGLTERQERYAQKIVNRVHTTWSENRLQAQRAPESRSSISSDLEQVEPIGEA